MTLRYPVKLEADDNGTVLVTCPRPAGGDHLR